MADHATRDQQRRTHIDFEQLGHTDLSSNRIDVLVDLCELEPEGAIEFAKQSRVR